MSTSENGDDSDIRREQIDLVLHHSREITQNDGEIEDVFEDTFQSDRLHNNFTDYFGTLPAVFRGELNRETRNELAEAILNVVVNYSDENYDEISESNEDLAEFLGGLASDHQLAIERRRRRVEQGHEYWSNIKSDLKIRSNKPAFTHELIIDYDHRIEFDSGLNATTILAGHFLDQVADSPDALGEDILSFIDEERIEQIHQISGDLLEQLEDYNGEVRSLRGNNESTAQDDVESDDASE